MSVATSAEPRKSKGVTLRKCNCLNEVSFAFLGMELLFLGDLTQSSSKPLQEFLILFADKKYIHKVFTCKKKKMIKKLKEERFPKGKTL